MQPSGPRFTLRPKPETKPEAPAAKPVAPVVEEPTSAAVEATKKAIRPIPSFLTDPRWTLSFDGPMKRGPGARK